MNSVTFFILHSLLKKNGSEKQQITSEGKAEVRWLLGRGRHRFVPSPLWGMLLKEEAHIHIGLLHLPARKRRGGQAPRSGGGGQPGGGQTVRQGPGLTNHGAVPGRRQDSGEPGIDSGGPAVRLEVHDGGA